MRTERRFLIAPSLVRLIQRERGISRRVAEGHFSSHPERDHFVRMEASGCHLVVLTTTPEGARVEERAEIPMRHAQALLDVCPSILAYTRSLIEVEGAEVLVDRFISPGTFDLLTVTFDDGLRSQEFVPPAWFGLEVTDEPAYASRSIALNGPPEVRDVPLSHEAVEALLDVFDASRSSDHEIGAHDNLGDSVLPQGDAEELPPVNAAAEPDRGADPHESRTEAADVAIEPTGFTEDDGMVARLAQALEASTSPQDSVTRPAAPDEGERPPVKRAS